MSTAERRALWFESPRELSLRSDPGAELREGEVRVTGIVSGISRGTELLLYTGMGPDPFDPSLGGRTGVPTYPRRYGYAWVGEVDESRSPCFSRRDRVFGLLPHGDAHEVPGDALRGLPPAMPAERAALAALLETAITCVWDARISVGERLLVLGGGALGLLVAFVARRAGATVHLVDPVLARRAAAHALGVDETCGDAGEVRDDFDVVVEATGHPEVLDEAIRHAGLEARIVVASFYGARVSPVRLGDEFHRRRLSLVSSQVSRIPPRMAPRWDADRRFALVLELLEDPRLDLLVTDRIPFGEAPAHYAALEAEPGRGLFSVLVYK